MCAFAHAHLPKVYATASEPSSVCSATSRHPLGYSFPTNTAFPALSCQLAIGGRLQSPEVLHWCPIMGVPSWPSPSRPPWPAPKPDPATGQGPAAALQRQQRRLCQSACPISGGTSCCTGSVSWGAASRRSDAAGQNAAPGRPAGCDMPGGQEGQQCTDRYGCPV